MSERSPTTLVISDGGLPAIVAVAIEAERSIASGGGGEAPRLMPWPTLEAAEACQQSAAGSVAGFLRLRTIEPVIPSPAPRATLSPSVDDALCLLAALATARSVGCTRVVWPIHFHHDDDSIASDIDRIAAAVDRAQLVGRLSLLDEAAGDPPIRFETPLVDLTDRQLADLVVDLDAPAYLAWWWRGLPDPASEAAALVERRAWLAALGQAGWAHAPPVAQVIRRADHSGTPA